ncbi:hypothetical protein FIBSPDRAFT_772799 [Athelia psychrophila]|uniref:Kinetochore protein Sos7 coiled-coil domain-containing protein n=1 Tax=Athelia psychrophila TaxID=1759441 RepID=A0A166WL22_9AGAM|nr:hypothetical protein FIBSPDRAFT_772799 [Fibularhizoctonia sp. CBS 109695]
MEIEQNLNTNMEASRAFQNSLKDAPLRIVADRDRFKAHKLEGQEETADETLRDPEFVANDVAAQIFFLRKLKFQYLEQNAKDKYIKTIVSDIDDAPLITAATNEQLRTNNTLKKANLKEGKGKLTQKQEDIRTLAPLVEQDYNKAKALTAEASLSQQILDARLALSRLRQAHPAPRLTISAATEQLDQQIARMQEYDETIQEISNSVATVKETVKENAKEVDRLRIKRAEVEKEVKRDDVQIDDGVAVALYDWFTASLDLHRALFSLISHHSPSENSLVLTYRVTPSRELTISLVFVPNTRQLASAEVEGFDDIDVAEVVDLHVLTNDVSGLVAAVLARARGV